MESILVILNPKPYLDTRTQASRLQLNRILCVPAWVFSRGSFSTACKLSFFHRFGKESNDCLCKLPPAHLDRPEVVHVGRSDANSDAQSRPQSESMVWVCDYSSAVARMAHTCRRFAKSQNYIYRNSMHFLY